jgi:small subunit ribosomal protein S21
MNVKTELRRTRPIFPGRAAIGTRLHKNRGSWYLFGNRLRFRGLFFVAHSERRGYLVQVLVRDNNVDQALRALKKKMQREGVFREMKLRRNYEKPSERRAREKAEAVRRYRKLLRKRMEREGY